MEGAFSVDPIFGEFAVIVAAVIELIEALSDALLSDPVSVVPIVSALALRPDKERLAVDLPRLELADAEAAVGIFHFSVTVELSVDIAPFRDGAVGMRHGARSRDLVAVLKGPRIGKCFRNDRSFGGNAVRDRSRKRPPAVIDFVRHRFDNGVLRLLNFRLFVPLVAPDEENAGRQPRREQSGKIQKLCLHQIFLLI